MKMPKLEWVDDRADVSKWFGERRFYGVNLDAISSGAEWWYRNGIGAKLVDSIGQAKAAAQAHFEKRLQEPMDFGDAMAAWGRGCETVDGVSGNRWKFDENGICVYSRLCDRGAWTEARLTKSMTLRKHTFHFEPEPEKVYATILEVEEWLCGECGEPCTRALNLERLSSLECASCGVTLHRPEETND